MYGAIIIQIVGLVIYGLVRVSVSVSKHIVTVITLHIIDSIKFIDLYKHIIRTCGVIIIINMVGLVILCSDREHYRRLY